MSKVWSTTFEDANDGTGDGILTFPEEMLTELGWKEGTVLDISVKDGKIILKSKESD